MAACSGRCLFLCCVVATAAMSLLYVAVLDAWQRPDRGARAGRPDEGGRDDGSRATTMAAGAVRRRRLGPRQAAAGAAAGGGWGRGRRRLGPRQAESAWRRRVPVSTAGCSLPLEATEVRSAAVRPFLAVEAAAPCVGGRPAVLSNATHLWTRDRRPDCCLSPLLTQPHSDSAYTVSGECSPLPARGLRVLGADGGGPEFVAVSCPGERWRDLHAFVPLTRPKAAAAYNCSAAAADGGCGGDPPANDSVSVLMLGLDAVSRLNFHRQMPLTADVLQQLGAIEMLGYNKVADNTFPNLVPVLSGLTENELRRACWGTHDTFDACPWLWKNYSAAGHWTMMVEDSPFLGLFHHNRPGFARPPTDFYPRPYMRAVDRKLGHDDTGTVYRCAGQRLQASVLLAYVRKFVEAMDAADRRYWALAWSTSATHDRLNGPQLLDRELSGLLRWLSDSGALRSTALLLLSDHGLRTGAFRQTRQGQLEERLPLLSVALPAWFASRYAAASARLRRNARRLCTPFDLHRTLLDLVHPDRALLNPTRRGAGRGRGRGRSLFSALPASRTCADAGVSEHWCACKRGVRPLAPQSGLARAAALRFVRQLNARLAPLRATATAAGGAGVGAGPCAPLRLRRVLSALRSPRDVTVTLETAPGGARFEATLALGDAAGGEEQLGGATLEAVSRVNLYGNQSACVSDPHLKPFCFCVY